MALSNDERPLDPADVRTIYRQRALHYDITSRLYGALGYRLESYRREGIQSLHLRPGDSVVELGCGTGANFEYLQRYIGKTGRIIGVDLTDSMLEQARARVKRHGWTNVELVQSEASDYPFPATGVDGVLSTYALTLFPEYDAIIRRAAHALHRERRLVIVDIKAPGGWPMSLMKAIMPILRPFGVQLGLMERKPWQSIERHMTLVSMLEHYFGTTYIAVGMAREK